MKKNELSLLLETAKAARLRAHAPYSEFYVGAALQLEDGTIIPGCNVENASYGGTVCAERTAFFTAVAAKGKIKPKAMVLVTDPLAVPCGLCLQVMAEFCGPKFPIYLATPKGIKKRLRFQQLMPNTFDRRALE